MRVPAFIQPIQAPLTQQLKNAGFDAIQAPVDDTWLPDITNGNFDTMVFVHCGSLSEPLETLKDYHTQVCRARSAPRSRTSSPARATATRSMTSIIDKMDAMLANPDPNSDYMKLAAAGARHRAARPAADRHARGTARGDLQQHLLDRLAVGCRSLRGARTRRGKPSTW